MATAPMSADTSRLSFAKVAASAGKSNIALTSFAKVTASTPGRDTRKENTPGQIRNSYGENLEEPASVSDPKHTIKTITEGHASQIEAVPVPIQGPGESEANLVDAVKALNVHVPPPSLVVNGSGATGNSRKADAVDVFSEDPFQRTDSGSELGTKPPSLDGKSITSGTTFALDEKESLRPDDSASVKAAEDDDTFSGVGGSIVAGSRIGSEAAARSYRAQFYEAPDRRNIQPALERQHPGVITPQSGSSEQQTTDEVKPKPLDVAGGPDAFNLFYRQTPDEKLLEALESVKDRIFLLRLEQDVIEFVKDSKMLTHKLADYYHMTHQVNEGAGAVRIFRTPFCRLPPSLTSISNPPTSGNTPPPQLPTMKIMRRGGDGDTGPSPSKATSEAGSDGKDKALSAKEKLSREEREAAYIRARERIFGKEDKSGEATPDTEEGNEMSRSSSVSTKDRAAQGKKSNKPAKQRREDNESFDKRSEYTTFFPQQQMPTWVPGTQYSTIVPQAFNGNIQGNYQNPVPSQFSSQNPQFNPAMMANPAMQYNNMPQQFPQQIQARFPNHSAPITTYGSPVQSPPIPQPQWQQQYPNMHPPQYQPQRPMMGGSPNTIPYAFGQLPSSANPSDPKSQHPIPGSYNRQGFNPKTQSFVPGNPGLPPQPMSHHGSPHHGSPHLSYNAYTPPQQQYPNAMGYSMARQGSNNSLPSYHASPHMAHRPMMHQAMPQNMPQMPQPGMSQNGQVGHHLPNYGNPATLPPKPPTGV
ncbi:hypothetical protein D0Z07_1100 [Hyphodiscus hymeniophilus]|uniref:SUZ domain-containing protein n=1 Tax=Hyphodiscus hymeniophilus TaxID=353542 RepID=A0A9P7B083_9HELO|nr:hypothetical protein D0Z07_1100 [Hyphodiscus hymeniophilus]